MWRSGQYLMEDCAASNAWVLTEMIDASRLQITKEETRQLFTRRARRGPIHAEEELVEEHAEECTLAEECTKESKLVSLGAARSFVSLGVARSSAQPEKNGEENHAEGEIAQVVMWEGLRGARGTIRRSSSG